MVFCPGFGPFDGVLRLSMSGIAFYSLNFSLHHFPNRRSPPRFCIHLPTCFLGPQFPLDPFISGVTPSGDSVFSPLFVGFFLQLKAPTQILDPPQIFTPFRPSSDSFPAGKKRSSRHTTAVCPQPTQTLFFFPSFFGLLCLFCRCFSNPDRLRPYSPSKTPAWDRSFFFFPRRSIHFFPPPPKPTPLGGLPPHGAFSSS